MGSYFVIFIPSILLFISNGYSEYSYSIEPDGSHMFYYYSRFGDLSGTYPVVEISTKFNQFFIYPNSPSCPNFPKKIEKNRADSSFINYKFTEIEQEFCCQYDGKYTLNISIADQQIGTIKKDSRTQNGGKFIFYDLQKEPYAIAYVDQAKWNVLIVEFLDKKSIIGSMEKGFDREHHDEQNKSRGHIPYYFFLTIKNENFIDSNILLFFATFITDTFWDYDIRPVGKPKWYLD